MSKKVDLRIIKTKRNLYEGLAQLLLEKPYENIKIKDICEKSLVNRSTFYDHYSSKGELLEQMLEEKQDSLTKNIDFEKITRNNYQELFLKYIENVLEFVDRSTEIQKNILTNKNNIVVKEKIFYTLKNDLQKYIDKINISSVSTEVLTNFYVGGFIELLVLHLMKPEDYSKEKIVNYSKTILERNKH